MARLLRLCAALALCFCISLLSLKAQDSNATTPQEHYALAVKFYDLFNYDSVRFHMAKAFELYETSEKDSSYFLLQGLDIKTDIEERKFRAGLDKTNKYLTELTSEFPEEQFNISEMIFLQGSIFARTGNYEDANERILRSIGINKIIKNESASDPKRVQDLDDHLAFQYSYLANVKLELNQTDSAAYYYERCIEAFMLNKEENILRLAWAHRGLALVAYFTNDLREALRLLYEVEKLTDENNERHHEVLSSTYAFFSNVHRGLLNLDSAIYYSEKAIVLNKKLSGERSFEVAIDLQNLASALNHKGDYSRSEKLLNESLDIALSLEGIDEVFLAYVYNSLITVSSNKYRSPQAEIDIYNEMLTIVNASKNPRAVSMVPTVYMNMGNTYHAKATFDREAGATDLAELNHKNSIENLKSSIELRLKGPIDSAGIFLAYGSLGKAHLEFNEFEEAEAAYMRSLQYTSVTTAIGDLCKIYLGLARLSLLQNREADFERYRQTAIDYAENVTEGQANLQSPLFSQLGYIHLENEEYEKAREFAYKAIQSNSLTPDTLANELPEIDQIITYPSLLEATALLANVSEQLYEQSGNREDLSRANSEYKQFVDYLFALLAELHNQKDIVNQVATSNNAFEGYARTNVELHKLTAESAYKETAFEASQLGKAIMLKNAMFVKGLDAYSQIPDSLITREDQINSSVEYYSGLLKNAILNGETEEAIEERRSVLFKASAEKTAFQKTLRTQYENYFELQYQQGTVSSGEIQDNLEANETFIEFLNSDDRIFAFVISNDNFDIVEISKPEDFEQRIIDFNEALKNKNMEGFSASSNALYELLISPIKEYLTTDKLIIVPDGNLWSINFDLLIADNSADKPHYLLNDYTISYTYSAYNRFNTKSKRSRRKKVLAFSYGEQEATATDPSTLRGPSLAELPGSALEIQNISNLVDGDYYFRSEAYESTFKSVASNYSVLHLAIHGEIDELDYDNSRLYFAKDEADTINDGLLFPFELYNMELNANLAVLSACNSGAGRITRGEGIMSLGRAFQYAGVNSLLLSKWEVSDAVAPEIIESFYKNLLEGMEKDEALRQAKISFLQSSDAVMSNPYYWGSFFVLGDTAPVKLKNDNTILYIALAVLLILVVLLRSQKKKANAA